MRVPNVHLVICMDPYISKGVVLQSIEQLRCLNWEQEIVVVGDKSWKPYCGEEQSFIEIENHIIDKSHTIEKRMEHLEKFLEQLDELSIKKVSLLGDLSFARWLSTYFDSRNIENIQVIEELDQRAWMTTAQLLNLWKLPIENCAVPMSRDNSLVIDPYEGRRLSEKFLAIFDLGPDTIWPNWMKIVVKRGDKATIRRMGLGTRIINEEDLDVSYHEARVLTFDLNSPLLHRSRIARVCLFGTQGQNQIFVPGDLAIESDENIDGLELMNILNYWREGRLRELSFQLQNMGLNISEVAMGKQALLLNNIQYYSQERVIGQMLLSSYAKIFSDKMDSREMGRIIQSVVNTTGVESEVLSLSIKILQLVGQRMQLSLAKGERLFQRLGSDYGRIRLGEAIFESLYKPVADQQLSETLREPLKGFVHFLSRLDLEVEKDMGAYSLKESA